MLKGGYSLLSFIYIKPENPPLDITFFFENIYLLRDKLKQKFCNHRDLGLLCNVMKIPQMIKKILLNNEFDPEASSPMSHTPDAVDFVQTSSSYYSV